MQDDDSNAGKDCQSCEVFLDISQAKGSYSLHTSSMIG